MHDSGSGTHDLNLTFFDRVLVFQTVLMFQIAFQGNGDHLHVFVGMKVKTRSSFYPVVIKYAQCPEMNSLWIVVICETKGVVGF